LVTQPSHRIVALKGLKDLAVPGGIAPSSASLTAGMAESVSSQGAPEPQRARDFWFKVNAELIIYGSTEPSAQVDIGGRKIRLRPDGSFSFRFSLPDGSYPLEATALAPDGEKRSASLRFSRHTQYQGEVGAHAQTKELKPPSADNVA
jgi:hypothetical protein